jgi:hypothetical protein
MGTLLEGTKMNPDLTFDGRAKQWAVFKQKLLKYAESQNFAYMLEAGQSICTIFQAASATAAKGKATRGPAVVAGSATISLDLGMYEAKEIKDEFKKRSVIKSVALAVRGNRKDKLGSDWADASQALLWQCVKTARTS